MKLERTHRYCLDAGNDNCLVVGPDGEEHFVAPATQRIPKLYIVSRQSELIPVYVGITAQPMAARLRLGLQADGQHGYHGYQWRGQPGLFLDIWCLKGANREEFTVELECIEAEVVFLVRKKYGQWPEFQTEIHFRQSKKFHRDSAVRILQQLQRNL